MSKRSRRKGPTSRDTRRDAIRAKLNIPPCTCPTCVAAKQRGVIRPRD